MTRPMILKSQTIVKQSITKSIDILIPATSVKRSFIILLLLLISMMSIISCISKKAINTKDIVLISFGSGGGFTGAVIKYQIYPNGKIIEIKALENNTHQVKKIKKKELKTINSMVNKLSSEHCEFSHPGNLYYFIELVKEQKMIHISWGDPAYPESVEVRELYEYLVNLVKS